MKKPRLLDLFCGAGGAAMGYHRAGFEVIGVDIVPQPNYPFEFYQRDALHVLAFGAGIKYVVLDALRYEVPGDFAAIHASPPCPAYSLVSGFQGVASDHPDLVGPTREALALVPLPSVIENVPGAPLRRDVVLCGEAFGLRVHRHRIFETREFLVMQAPHQRHRLRGGRTNCETGPGIARWITGNYADHDDASDAMGIDWMTRRELANAIPPAYTEYIGGYLLAEVNARALRAAA
jgi:DNA (cytosine-5)-methyltransferase 1